MSCTRGCVGTPICNALDLCCIQFRHDCGKECLGVADGYSTIQINAVGGLEVCSNVGGVCTCTNCCLDEVVSDDTCNEGGIGSEYMLREATLAGGILTLNGAPEHTSLSVAGAQLTGGGPGAPSVIPNETTDQFQAQLALTNTSLCRSMVVSVSANMVLNYGTPTVGGSYSCMFRLDADTLGGTVAILVPRIVTPLPAGIINFGQSGTLTYTEVIAPGVTVTYTAKCQAFVTIAGFPVASTSNAIQLNITGHTI